MPGEREPVREEGKAPLAPRGRWGRLLWGTWDWKRPLKSLAFIYLALCLVACGFSNRLIFHPPPARYGRGASHLRLLNDKEGRQVAAFWYPRREADGPVLLWSHGNAEDLGSLAPLLAEIHAEGFAVLAYDYPGYGLSEGSPTEQGCYDAVEAAFTYLTAEEGVRSSDIILVGQSVGSGPACWLAEREETGGLILISPFRSAFLTVTRIPLFPGDKFRNIKRIGHIGKPLLVIHGENDRTIPFAEGKALYERHPGPKRFLAIPGARHNTIWHAGFEDIIAAFKSFPPQSGERR